MYRCQGVGSGSRPERMTLPRQSSESSALWLSKVIFSILPTQCECLWQWIMSFHICALIRVFNKQSAAAGDGLWAAVEAVSSVGTLPARMITRVQNFWECSPELQVLQLPIFTLVSLVYFSLCLSLSDTDTLRHHRCHYIACCSNWRSNFQAPPEHLILFLTHGSCTLLPLHIWLEQNWIFFGFYKQ